VVRENKPTPNERLLELIRKPSGAGEAAEGGPGVPSVRPPQPGRPARLGFGRSVHVGVDISPTRIVCVRITGRDAGFVLLGAAVAAVPQGVEPGGEAFVELLRDTLAGLCQGGPPPRLWAAAQTSRANLQFITIPKVSSAQVDNAVFWTAKKELGFDEASVIFDFERRGELSEKGAARLGAMVYTVPRAPSAVIREAFARAGFPLAGLTLEPFAHQTLIRRRIVPGAEGAVANLHVGQSWSRLEIFSNGNLMFMRVIKTSMSGMEQAVLDVLAKRRQEAAPPPSAAEPALETAEETVLDLDAMGPGGPGLVLELEAPAAGAAPDEPRAEPAPAGEPGLPAATPAEARELLRSIIFECDSIDVCRPGEGVGPGEVMAMLEPVASRLVRQVEMTLKHYRESLGHDPVTRLTISGELGGSRLFVDYIAGELGLPCQPLDPLAGRLNGQEAGLDPGAPLPVYTQALGLALADAASTPSVFFTYREKAAARMSRLLEQWTLIVLAAVLATLAVLTFFAVSERRTLEARRAGLAREIASLDAATDPAVLERMTAELRARRTKLVRYLKNRRTAGIWGEALALAPDGVGVGSMTVEYGGPHNPEPDKAVSRQPARAAAGKTPVPAVAARLVVDGMVTGDVRLLESMLASYVVALEGSPLFEDVSVKKNEIVALEGGAAGLRFVVALGLSEQ